MTMHGDRSARKWSRKSWLLAALTAIGFAALAFGLCPGWAESSRGEALSGVEDCSRRGAVAEDRAVRPVLSHNGLEAHPEQAADAGSGRDVGGDSIRDVGWERLPRTDVSIARILLRWRPDAKYLFRHRRLNPADTYLPEEERDVLAQVVHRFADLMARAEHRQDQAIRRGVARLVSEGKLTGVRPGRSRFRALALSLRSDGGAGGSANGRRTRSMRGTRVSRRLQTAYYYDGEHFYRAPMNELPAAQEVEKVRRTLALELLTTVTSYFRVRGILSAEDAGRLRQTLVESE